MYDIEINQPNLPEVWVWVDPQLIKIAFTYLLDNAIKALKGRPVKRLYFSIVTKKGEVVIKIEDTGKGMTEEEIQQILTEFFVRNNRISVGVTIARMILGLHAGRLSYKSALGEGTTTIVTLPLNNQENVK